MEETKEQHAHICLLCEESFMSESEFLKVCPKCYIKHHIDLGVQEIVSAERERIMEGLDERRKEMEAYVDAQFQIYDKKSKKRMRWSKLVFYFYLAMAVFWFVFSLINRDSQS